MLSLELYKKLYLIRRAEEAIIKYYPENDMKTPMHMSMGEEAIAVGVCHVLNNDDQVFSSYRSHAAFLAKTQDINEFFAEIYARDIALLKGKGGSMHLCDPDSNFMGASAIVGSHIPVAVGTAFANKYQKNKKVAIVFFGDGAVDEGVFWESLNVACLMKLPVIFVCVDNGFAVHTPASARRGYNSLVDIISKYNCEVFKCDSTDVEEIYNLTVKAVKTVREKSTPCFLELKCYRYFEHVGILEDFDAGYRSKDEFLKWYSLDPIKLQREKLIKQKVDVKDIENIEREIDRTIEKSILLVKNAELSSPSELYNGVFK